MVVKYNIDQNGKNEREAKKKKMKLITTKNIEINKFCTLCTFYVSFFGTRDCHNHLQCTLGKDCNSNKMLKMRNKTKAHLFSEFIFHFSPCSLFSTGFYCFNGKSLFKNTNFVPYRWGLEVGEQNMANFK